MSDDPKTVTAKPKWKNIGVRAITALLMGGVAIIPFYFGGVFWMILVGLVAGGAVWEWVRMTETTPTKIAYIIPILGVILVMLGSHLEAYQTTFIFATLTAAIAALERIRRNGAIWAGLGFLYIAIPAILLVYLRGKTSGVAATGFKDLIFVILVVIAADTGAYFGGSYFQGPKMAPKLSPNKTWSGFFSGMIFAPFIGCIVGLIIGFSAIHAAIIALPIMVFSVVGDFLESALKRKLKVKDTGGLLPGHGGVLDRVDSLMMAVVFVALIMAVSPTLWPQL
ncbi:MAG: phosphatidate cytidylyltransferase [Maricaulaceae bacterium]